MSLSLLKRNKKYQNRKITTYVPDTVETGVVMKIKIWTTTVPIGNWLNQKTDKNGRYLTYKSATFRSNEIDNSIQNNTYEKSSGYLRKIFGYLRKIFGNIFGHSFASQNPLYFLKVSSTDQIYGNKTTFQNEITMSSKRLKSNLNIVKQIRKLKFCMLPLQGGKRNAQRTKTYYNTGLYIALTWQKTPPEASQWAKYISILYWPSSKSTRVDFFSWKGLLIKKLQINKIETSLIVFEVFNWWTASLISGK